MKFKSIFLFLWTQSASHVLFWMMNYHQQTEMAKTNLIIDVFKLRRNSHNIQLTILKCTIKWHLVHSVSHNHQVIIDPYLSINWIPSLPSSALAKKISISFLPFTLCWFFSWNYSVISLQQCPWKADIHTSHRERAVSFLQSSTPWHSPLTAKKKKSTFFLHWVNIWHPRGSHDASSSFHQLQLRPVILSLSFPIC